MAIHIALEGIDNCGKTTLCEALATAFENRGQRTVVSREFSTEYGKILKQRLYNRDEPPSPNEKAIAFALDRLIRFEAIAKAKCDIVLWDRYVFSALVYRGVEKVDGSWVQAINSVFPTPHLNLYLDVTPQEARARGKAARKSCPYSEEFLLSCRNEYLRYVGIGTLMRLQAKTLEEQVIEVFSLVKQS